MLQATRGDREVNGGLRVGILLGSGCYSRSMQRRFPCRLGVPATAILWLALASLAMPTSGMARDETRDPARPALAGMPLADALRMLQRQGLRIVFTTNVVRPGMRVTSEPTAARSDLRAVLDEILSTHGLESRNAAQGTVVVVPKKPPVAQEEPRRSSIAGVIRSRRDMRPVEGVRLTLVDADLGETSDAEGRFTFVGLAEGPIKLEIRRRGFVVETVQEEVTEGKRDSSTSCSTRHRSPKRWSW